MTNPYRSIELLAPAGTPACLHAAVRAGADAVYVGAEEFNARRGAGNFTLDDLAAACDFAHLRGTRVYLTLNVAIMPGEERRALELAARAWKRGVDAFIVQDIGAAAALKRMIPEADLHISTQMNTCTLDGVHAAAALGARRITFARELGLSEVAELSAAAHEQGMTTECFAHGALCVCYSGQCLMSSMIGGRSANRGTCAQACRLPYLLRDEDADSALPAPGEHLLSPKDLCTADMLDRLAACGVDSLKIEGRMKSPEYVSAVVGVYRAVLDRLADAADAEISAAEQARKRLSAEELARRVREAGAGATADELRTLAEAFSRGFTHAYLDGERGNDIMGYGRPNNRGVLAGRVEKSESGEVALRVQAEMQLHEGDVLEFWTGKGRVTVTLSDIRYEKGGIATFAVEGRVSKGDRAFRVRDASMAFQDSELDPKLPATCTVRMRIGDPLRIVVRANGEHAEFEGPVVEAARTKAVTPEEVREHVDRLGNTPFFFKAVHVDVQDGAGIGFSALHKARTQALRKLEEALLSPWRGREAGDVGEALSWRPGFDGGEESRAKGAKGGRRAAFAKGGEDAGFAPEDIESAKDATDEEGIEEGAGDQGISIVAFATNPACARAAKRAGADAVFAAALHYRRGEACVAGRIDATPDTAGYPGRSNAALPVIDRRPASRDLQDFDAWRWLRPGKPLFVENFGQLVRASASGALPEAGPHIPITNALSLSVAEAAGASRVWLSPELSLAQIRELSRGARVPLGLFVCGNQELMTTEHCLLMSEGLCAQRCGTCPRRTRLHTLEDRKGYRFPIVTDCCGRSHLYNAVRFDAVHLMPDLIDAGVSAFLVDTTLMDAEEAAREVARVARARRSALRDGSAVAKIPGRTTGHLFRGVQ